MVLLLTFPCLTLRRVYCLPKTRYREVRFLNTDICIYMCLSLIVYLKLWTFLDGGALLFVKEKEIAPSVLGFLCFCINILVIVIFTYRVTPTELLRILGASSIQECLVQDAVLLQIGESVYTYRATSRFGSVLAIQE